MTQFSRRTVVCAIDVLDQKLSQAKTSQLVLRLGPEINNAIRGEEVSVRKRMNDLISFVDEHPDYKVDGCDLTQLLVERAIAMLPSDAAVEPWDLPSDPTPEDEALKRSIEQDGFKLGGGTLRRALPGDVKLPEAQSELMVLLERHGISTAKGHLDQALDAHTRGKWASANGQLRTFFEALLDELAVRIDPSAANVPSGHPRRTKLAASGFLIGSLNEWDNDGKGYINGLVKRLHPAGAHPGLSDDDDSTFRLHVVLITAALIMRRYDQRVSAG